MRVLIQYIVGIDKNVVLPKFNSSSFLKRSNEQKININITAPAYGKKAIVFATCFVNYNEPSIGKSALEVLAFNGIEINTVYPRCCGMPQLEQGDIKRVASNALLTARERMPFINDGLPIISLIPSCT
jgi:glycerol-3-phosphate dehydrogenase subunit C